MRQELIVPVSSLVTRIKTVLQQTMNLEGVWVQGEVSNLTKHRSGHYYFSIKDESSELSCVMFSTYVRKLTFNLEEGMKILVQGSVNVYEQRGSLQFYVKAMKQDGIGNLYLEFEERKKRLLQQGYFEESHKKEKPEWIENIAIVTAKEGAALQDVIKTIHSRWPAMHMTLYPAYVQGNNAAKTMINALLKADQNHHDAILLVRGGGSFEDLFCFNDEELVKTIYSLQTYIVTGVGHEVDTTLVDLVSDHRCVTPTAAGQWVSADYRDLQKKVTIYKNSLNQIMQNKVQTSRQHLNFYKNYPYFLDPHSYIFEKTLKLDSYITTLENVSFFKEKKEQQLSYMKNQLQMNIQKQLDSKQNQYSMIHLDESMNNYINKQNEHFNKTISLLDAYSPLKTMKRGYSIALKENRIIKSIQDVEIDDEVNIQLLNGNIKTKVIKKEEKHD